MPPQTRCCGSHARVLSPSSLGWDTFCAVRYARRALPPNSGRCPTRLTSASQERADRWICSSARSTCSCAVTSTALPCRWCIPAFAVPASSTPCVSPPARPSVPCSPRKSSCTQGSPCASPGSLQTWWYFHTRTHQPRMPTKHRYPGHNRVEEGTMHGPNRKPYVWTHRAAVIGMGGLLFLGGYLTALWTPCHTTGLTSPVQAAED